MRFPLAAGALALLLSLPAVAQEAAPADAPAPSTVRFGGKRTSGSGGYLGRSGYLQVGSRWRLRASYADYTFDSATSTTRTAGLRATYQGESLSVGANLSVTPLVDDYRSASWGLEGGWSFLPEDEASTIEEWEVNAWWTQTRHHQTIPRTAAARPRRDLDIHQHDIGVGASVTAWKATLSADAYASRYFFDEFDLLLAASRSQPRLGAAVSLINGFPSGGGSVRLEYEAARWLTPYVAFSGTSYKIGGNPPSRALSAGASLRRGVIGADVSYERVRQSGAPDSSYLTVGGSLRF